MQLSVKSQCICENNKVNIDYENKKEFVNIVKDLIDNETVQKMKNYRQHYDCSCYEHCLEVAYWSFLVCKKLNLDYKSAARAGILHDLFLYDWRCSSKLLNLDGLHAFVHPKIALKNSSLLFDLNEKEKDIIVKHMWPVTFFSFPKYRESYIITVMDKLSALKSFYEHYKPSIGKKSIAKYAYVFFATLTLRIL